MLSLAARVFSSRTGDAVFSRWYGAGCCGITAVAVAAAAADSISASRRPPRGQTRMVSST